MRYIAFTQTVASWLLTHTHLINKINSVLLDDGVANNLKKVDIAEGPLRISATEDGRVIAVWHIDYLSGTGVEQWGVVKQSSPFGLKDKPEISNEVFERAIYVINQRLQSLLLDSAFHHRTQPNGVQTCMAGRGSVQRHFSIGYWEGDVQVGHSRTRALICVGPSDSFDSLGNATFVEGQHLSFLVNAANQLLNPKQRRPFYDRKFDIFGIRDTENESVSRDVNVGAAALEQLPEQGDVYRTLAWSYSDWVAETSPLSPDQRRILTSDTILRSPLRIMGPGGSGKTLLMQLLALRRLEDAKRVSKPLNVLYIVHNVAMESMVKDRFLTLGASEFFSEGKQNLRITTLSEYGKKELGLTETTVINSDAHETKEYQLSEVTVALRAVFSDQINKIRKTNLLAQVAVNEDLFLIFARLVMAEISSAIKGHGLTEDKLRYVGSERPLSRLHGLLDKEEREIVFDVFQHYHNAVFEDFGVLDSDDIALSLVGSMRTPIWALKRKSLGFDYVFVDEMQLFNENERRLFPLLTRSTESYVPIVLALDEAQEIYGQTTAGFGALGISQITNESLPSIFRSTQAIIDLAFYIIQQTTELFGPEFPDFTGIRANMEPSNHRFAGPPRLEVCGSEARNIGRFVVKRVRELRSMQLRQIAVVCHSEHYWGVLQDELRESDLPLRILSQRGERLAQNQPTVVLARPAHVGGQEFDAVVAVGLEQGVVPPIVHDNAALAMAVEQQALREMYLAFTRARYQLWLVIGANTRPTAIIQSAIRQGLVNE